MIVKLTARNATFTSSLRLLAVTAALAATACHTTDHASEVAGASGQQSQGHYEGGRMGSYETFLYGAFETSMQAAPGPGYITPFYLYKTPAAVNDRGWQEMDFEAFGKDGRFQTQILTPGNPRTQHNIFHQLDQPVYSAFHTYRMEWTPTALRFLVDGNLLRTETDPVVYGKLLSDAEPMNLYVQLWAGTSDWSGQFTASTVPVWALYKYIQVEKYTPGSGPNGGDFTVEWRDNFASIDQSRWGVSNASTPADGAVNGYTPSQVSAKNNTLVLYFSN